MHTCIHTHDRLFTFTHANTHEHTRTHSQAALEGLVGLVQQLQKHQLNGRVVDPGDLITLSTFASAVQPVFKPLVPAAVVCKAIAQTTAGGMTALYDAVVGAASRLRPCKRTNVLVLLTDGSDTSSKSSLDDALAALAAAARTAREAGRCLQVLLLSVGTEGLDSLRRMEQAVLRAQGQCALRQVENSGEAIRAGFSWLASKVTRRTRAHAPCPPTRPPKHTQSLAHACTHTQTVCTLVGRGHLRVRGDDRAHRRQGLLTSL